VIVVAVLGAVLLGTLVLTAVAYNRFISQRNGVRDAWADVDAELRRRYDLIPNLAMTAGGYASHERELLDHVARARAVGTGAADRTAPEQAVVVGLRHLVAVAEAYPDLRADRHFLELQRELAVTEDRIAIARRIYNASVRTYNTRLETFPTNLAGRAGGFRRAAYFDVEEAVRHEVPSAA
jgi:LemA protein